MAERVDMSFRNKEVKMWFIIMVPIFIIGSIAMLTNEPASRYLPFLILMAGFATYYIWRYRYRRRKKKTGNKQ
ncbi:hypothetical protein DP120_09235 [Planococcus halotolerans]|uniref:Uncharacterized protein n=1 Tax=Planococcus halotolerans TaxID=2233542 RepID=A0A365KWU5_9BACL|nr:hypothetical protein DP120_09235 [Planococcus halotolerans]